MFPPAPRGVAVPGKENWTLLPKEALCLSAAGLCKRLRAADAGELRLCRGDTAWRNAGHQHSCITVLATPGSSHKGEEAFGNRELGFLYVERF